MLFIIKLNKILIKINSKSNNKKTIIRICQLEINWSFLNKKEFFKNIFRRRPNFKI